MNCEKKKYSSQEIFEHLPVLKALRIMAVPTIMSQIIVLIYKYGRYFLCKQSQ